MNWQPQSIVVGVDGSETSRVAAEHGVSLARLWKGKLYLVLVVRTPEGWWGLGGAPPSPEALSTALAEGQAEILNELEDRTRPRGGRLRDSRRARRTTLAADRRRRGQSSRA